MLATGAAGSDGKGKGSSGYHSTITEDDTYYVCRICKLIHKSSEAAPQGPKQHTVPPYARGDGPAKHGRGKDGWVLKSCSCEWVLQPSAQAPGKCRVLGCGP